MLDRRMLLPVCALLSLLVPSTGRAQLDWVHTTIDPSTPSPGIDVGRGVAMTLEPKSERPILSYSTATTNQLRVAEYVGAGGTCGPDETWQCYFPEATTVGPSTDIAVFSGSLTWKMGVVYRADALNDVVLWERTWVGIPIPGHWETSREVVLEGPTFSTAGKHVTLAYDSTGDPHIAFWQPSGLVDDRLIYATRVGSGGSCGGGAAAGAWDCTTLEIGNDLGQHPSIAVTPNDLVAISCFDGSGGGLRLIEYAGIGTGSCAAGATGWYCQTIDPDVPVCHATSIGIIGEPGDFEIQIAYHVGSQTTTWGEVRMAQPDLTSGNCGGGLWDCFALEATGTADDMGLALGHDSEGAAVVAYRRPTYGDVRLAKDMRSIVIVDACGPTGSPLPFQGWQCQTMVSSATFFEPGAWLDLVMTRSDDPILAYHALDSASGTGEVRLAHEWLFRDGLERGSTSSWSAAVGTE